MSITDVIKKVALGTDKQRTDAIDNSLQRLQECIEREQAEYTPLREAQKRRYELTIQLCGNIKKLRGIHARRIELNEAEYESEDDVFLEAQRGVTDFDYSELEDETCKLLEEYDAISRKIWEMEENHQDAFTDCTTAIHGAMSSLQKDCKARDIVPPAV